MCPVNSQNEEKLAQYAVSPAHGRGGSQDEVKLAYYALRPLPRPRPRWLAGRGENFTSTPSVYSSSLLRWLERLSYCLEYICPLVDFNMNYQYILQTLMYIDVFQSVDSLILLRMQSILRPCLVHKSQDFFQSRLKSLYSLKITSLFVFRDKKVPSPSLEVIE